MLFSDFPITEVDSEETEQAIAELQKIERDELGNDQPHADHRLRGSASDVLTATGFVNGKGQFSTPTESTPLNRSPKNLSQVITSATPTAVPN